MFGVLIRIDAQDAGGTPAPLYLASLDMPELCHLDGQQWFPALAQLPELPYDFFGGAFNGQITAPRISFAVDTGDLAGFSTRRYAAARVRLWAGDITAPDIGVPPAIGPLELWFDGEMVAEPAHGEDRRASFTASVVDTWLDDPLLPLFGGTGGLDGPDDAEGRTKPLAMGDLRFAAGELIDRVENIWMVSHAGFDSMSVVYDRVARLGSSSGDFADLAALVAANVTEGRWATAKAVGLVKTGAPPDGKIAFDLLGDNAGAGGAVMKAGAMIARLAELKGGTVNAASLAALDVARPYNLALQIVGQTSARTAIQQLADSVGAVAGVSWTGEMFAQALAIGAPVETLAADDTSTLAVTAVDEREKVPPFWRLATQAEPSWQVYDQGEVALDYVWRGEWNALRTYRVDDVVNSESGSSYVYINATPSAGNPLPTLPATSNTWWQLFGAGGARIFTSGKVSAPASLTLDFRNRLLSTPISYTRAGTATRTNEQGLIEAVAADVTRYDYDPVSRALLGLLIEPAATNLVVNSLLDGSNLATQSVTVTAVPHVISFYGSGSITLSGAHVAVVNGTGAYPARTTLVFTPTAGSLTLTVSGTVQFAQLETGTFATSFIPTAASAVTRNADDASITGTDFSDFFNASEGTIFVEGAIPPAADGANGNYYLSLNNGTLNERIDILDTNGSRVIVSDGGVTQASIQKTPEPAGSVRLALAFKVNDLAFVENGGAVSPDTTATLPTVDRLTIGARGAVAAGTQAGGHISSIRFYPKRLTDTELPALTGFPTAASTGDLFIDENDNNTVYQFDGTGWIKVVSAVASQITDQAPAATDGTIEGSADVTKAIQGTALIEVAYDFAGVVKSAQFPINKSYKLVTSGGVEITSGVTWGVSTTSGGWSGTAPSITGTGAGALAINSGPNVSTAQVRVTATLNGRQYTFTADVKQKLDDPPVSGGSSGTTASEQFVKSVSTAWVDATGELVANTGAGITNFDLTAANLAISSNDLTPPVNGSSNVQGQWLWWDGGAWQVVGTVSDSSPDVTFTASEESPGSLTVNKQKTGLSGATQYKFKLQLKISSGTVDPVIVSGTASIEGGT